MSVQVRRRREASAFLSSFVGAQGELIVDTTNNRVQVHDGATPGGWPAARLTDVVARSSVADAAYTVLPSDRTVAFTALTAARVISLPAASAFPTGTQLLVVDESGGCSATNTITLTRAGSDTINGATSAVLALPWGYLALVSNGASRWTIVDQSTTSLAQQNANSVAITGGTISGAAGSFTALATTGTATLGALLKLAPGNTFGASIANGGSTSQFFDDGNGHVESNFALWLNSYSASGDVQICRAAKTTYVNGPLVLAAACKLASYTVATLPAGTNGLQAFASNGRKSGEASGAGTGVTVVYSNGVWRRLSDETAVAA